VTEAVKASEPSEDWLAFRFVSGHRALDLTATFGDRYRGGVERLRHPADLARWLGGAGIPSLTPPSVQHLQDARQLREVIYRLTLAALQGAPIDAIDLDALNAWAMMPRLAPQLDSQLHCQWTARNPVEGALAMIACEAIALLSGPERQLIRQCAAAPACSLLYIDRSRGQRRRWCEMGRCGSRVKMAEYRKRCAAGSDRT
jgi:predicted RNA-binding Zn ribbon-like protein